MVAPEHVIGSFERKSFSAWIFLITIIMLKLPIIPLCKRIGPVSTYLCDLNISICVALISNGSVRLDTARKCCLRPIFFSTLEIIYRHQLPLRLHNQSFVVSCLPPLMLINLNNYTLSLTTYVFRYYHLKLHFYWVLSVLSILYSFCLNVTSFIINFIWNIPFIHPLFLSLLIKCKQLVFQRIKLLTVHTFVVKHSI